jgi:hypothetical protein
MNKFSEGLGGDSFYMYSPCDSIVKEIKPKYFTCLPIWGGGSVLSV